MRKEDVVATSAFWKIYRRVFKVAEIEQSTPLKWVFGATLLTFFISFSDWVLRDTISISSISTGKALCWEYFQSCTDWYFLQALPDGYSQTLLYAILFGGMLLAVYYMQKGRWVYAHALLATLLLWKIFVLFVLTRSFAANFDYYHVIFSLVLLFLPFKLFFLKFIFALLYFLAATIKLHEGWVLGSYFTSLKTGLPIFGDALAPAVTLSVVLAQIVLAWLLLSNAKQIRLLALTYFTIFHLYSSILVYYRYPVTVLPTLLILFGLFPSKTKAPPIKKALIGWVFVGLLLLLQFVAISIPGDQKETLEGNYFGLFMFEANHQCRSLVTMYEGETIVGTRDFHNIHAPVRCDPYVEWFRLKEKCRLDPTITSITWQFDHSINGGPFYRMVDTEDACALSYRVFTRNAWIKPPEEGAPAMGRPVKNVY